MLLNEDACRGQQPTTVVRKTQIACAADVDVAYPATFLRVPDSAPPENLARNIGVQLPHFVLLVLELDRRIGLAADVVGCLYVCGEQLVVDEVGRRCVRKVGERGLEPGHQV